MNQERFQQLKSELKNEYAKYPVRPAPADIFKAFKLCAFEDTRVVVIGQDPYPFGNHADGLAFSSKEVDTPASLRYILREVDRDITRTTSYQEYKQAFPTNRLDSWAKQGILLLNTSLTVRAGEPNSHKELGWTPFIEFVLTSLWNLDRSLVFVVWGEQAKKALLPVVKANPKQVHYILESGHPASGSHGKDKFSGCNHFSKINNYFYRGQLPEIDWKLNAN